LTAGILVALGALAVYAAVKAYLPGLTEAHWHQVETGMTPEQVEALLGAPQRTFPVEKVVEGLKEGFPTTTVTIRLWSAADAPFAVGMVGFDVDGRVVHTRMMPRPPGENSEFVKWRRWLFYR
jgi:hypothetical protein